MKKYLFYSFLLHVLLLACAFLMYKAPEKIETKPLIADIIIPETPRNKREPKMPAPARQHRERAERMSRLPKDLPAPKVFSAVPSARVPEKKSAPAPSRDTLQKNTGREKSTGTPPARSSGDTGSQAGPGALPGTGSAGTGTSSGKSARALPSHEKLFDREIIGKLAHEENVRHDKGITFDTKDYKYYGYMQRLKERIESAWYYPQDAAERGVQGDLDIRFTIRKDGGLGNVELVRTSGHRNLDEAALKALRNAQPYWPLPAGTETDEDGLTITGHFIYSLYGMSLR